MHPARTMENEQKPEASERSIWNQIRRHRLLLVGAFCWFVMVLTALMPLRVAPFVYPYVLGWALLFMLSSTVRKLPLWFVGGSASAIFAGAAALVGWPLDATLLLMVAGIFITLAIAKALGGHEDDFEGGVRTAVDESGLEPTTIGPNDTSMSVELQRARIHRRVLSVLAISPVDSGHAEADARASLAGLLSDENYAFDLLAVRDDHFVMMLPESGSEKAFQLVTRLRAVARVKLGLELNIGVSSFPAESTLKGLLDRAVSEMGEEARNRQSI